MTTYSVMTAFGEGDERRQNRIKEVIEVALTDHARVALIRLDLLFPADDIEYRNDNAAITRFLKHLNIRLPAHLSEHHCKLSKLNKFKIRSVWSRDVKKYYVALLMNRDVFCYPGAFETRDDNLYTMIGDCWLKAIGIDDIRYRNLVHIPKDCTSYLHRTDLEEEGIEFFYPLVADELDRLTIVNSNDRETTRRNFGCTQG